MRFLHTADWHLGRAFSGFPAEKREALRKGRMESLGRLFEHARRSGIELMLVAGDQIDSGDTASDGVLRELLAVIGAYPGIRVVMITGNHDPSSPLGIFNRIDAQLFPGNLEVVTEGQQLQLEEGATIFAASLQSKNGRSNPLEWIPARSTADEIRIGLAHGSLAIPGRFKSDDFPIPPSYAEDAQLDYLALGHWHSQYIHDERTAYPGTHEPLGFGERSGALEVELLAPDAVPEIRPLAIEPTFKWIEESRSINGTLSEELLELLRSGGSGEILRLRLEGEIPAEERETLDAALDIAGHKRFALFVEDETRIAGEREGMADTEGIGYLAEVIRRIEGGGTVRAPDSAGIEQLEIRDEEVRAAALRRIHAFLRKEGLL
jgi:DNA repair exonuclease SbcCD nuclease subunit